MAKSVAAKTAPTSEQWRDLYAAANEFRRAVCWEWVDDAAIFGVQDPEDGQRYYCSIMGCGGAEFGIAAYRGCEGLQFLINLLEMEDADEMAELADDLMFLQDALVFTLEDRENLDKSDLAVIRSLGLKYRGRGEWPSFRDYTPGLAPWFLTGKQCRTLTHILGQALDVAAECKKGQTTDILVGPDNEIMLRVPRKTAAGLEWSSRFLREQEEQIAYAGIKLSDQLLVQKLKKLPSQKKQSLELDRFYLPAAIHDQERPYYPQMLAIIDHADGIALHAGITEGKTSSEMHPGDVLLGLLLEGESKPRRILVKRQRLFMLLRQFCEQIGIEIRLADRLPKIAEFRRGLREFAQR